MKKSICVILMAVLLLCFTGCDRSYTCSLDVQCAGNDHWLIVDDVEQDEYCFSLEMFNSWPLTFYSSIDLRSDGEDPDWHEDDYMKERFEVYSYVDDTYTLTMELNDSDKYLLDFLRVAIIVDGELRVYKYNNWFEKIYHEENDPDTILHFNSKKEIFDDIEMHLSAGESKEIVIFYWLEESELYDRNGERLRGWADKSYDANSIYLKLNIRGSNS